MSTVLWVLGVWLLVSLPVAMIIGRLCSLNDLRSVKISISEDPTTAPAADRAAFGALRIPA